MLIGAVAIFLASICFCWYQNRSKWRMSLLPPKFGEKLPNSKPPKSSSQSPTSSNSSTPKARPQRLDKDIPPISLHICEDDNEETSQSVSRFPSIDATQKVSSSTSLSPESISTSIMASSTRTSLMPPPSCLAPIAGQLTDRLPVSSVNLSALRPINPTMAPAAKKSRKVHLAPGHSPLDWAMLQKSGANLSGVHRMLRVTPSVLKLHNGRKGMPAWSCYQGMVYNITPYLPFHPGGEGELKRAAGKDGEKLFTEAHPWVAWTQMLNGCMVGVLVAENDPKADRIGREI